jgi:flagellar protein FliS
MDARSSYRESSVRGANPVRLVLCLYEQAIEDLRRAVIAMEKGAIEVRTREINHALMVIAQLQSSLDMERGGEVAKNLARFYGVVRAGLTDAQMKQSAALLERQISHLAEVHEAWLEVERATATAAADRISPASPPETPAIAPPEPSGADWNA